MKATFRIILICILAVASGITGIANAYQLFGAEDIAPCVTYTQPDYYGTQFQAKLWGNSIWWEQETSDGYTIALNQATGYWCYAVLDSNGFYTHSTYRVGIDSPPPTIQPHLRRSSPGGCEAVVEGSALR